MMKKLIKKTLEERLEKMDQLTNAESAYVHGGDNNPIIYPPVTQTPNYSVKINPGGGTVTYKINF